MFFVVVYMVSNVENHTLDSSSVRVLWTGLRDGEDANSSYYVTYTPIQDSQIVDLNGTRNDPNANAIKLDATADDNNVYFVDVSYALDYCSRSMLLEPRVL